MCNIKLLRAKRWNHVTFSSSHFYYHYPIWRRRRRRSTHSMHNGLITLLSYTSPLAAYNHHTSSSSSSSSLCKYMRKIFRGLIRYSNNELKLLFQPRQRQRPFENLGRISAGGPICCYICKNKKKYIVDEEVRYICWPAIIAQYHIVKIFRSTFVLISHITRSVASSAKLQAMYYSIKCKVWYHNFNDARGAQKN